MRKKRNLLILAGLAAIIVVTLVMNLGVERKDRTEVTIDEVEIGTLTAKVSGPGRVRAERTVQISSSVMGRVVELAVEEGDAVTRGQLLLRLDDVYYRSQVEQARARVERTAAESAMAERELADAEEQFSRQLISEKERDDFRAIAATYRQAHQEARAALRAAEDQLEETVFHAPIDGVVTRLNIEEGENVVTGTMNQPGTVLMTLSDMSSMEVEVEIDETDIVDVELGQRAEIDVEALADTTLGAVVTEVGNSGITSMAGTQEEVTNFLVTVLVDEAHVMLKPGMTATVEIITAVHDSVLNVPIQSVVSRLPSELEKQESDEEEGERSEAPEPRRKRSEREDEEEIEGVFVVTEEDQALFVPVEASIADELSIEVDGDLEEGQKVVSGPYKVLRTLKNGTDLKIEEEGEPSEGTEE